MTKNMNNNISTFHLEDRMNRFDSAFSSSQRSNPSWVRFVLMAFLLTIGTLSYVSAQSINRASPAGNVNQACEGQQVTYNTENLGVGGGVGYTWTVVGGFFVTGNGTPSITVQWQNQGNQSLTITRNNFGTVTATTNNVAVSRTPTPAVGGPNVVCINTEHTYSTPAVAGSNYVWNITPAANWVNIGGAPPGSNFINVRWIQTGNATVSVTETAIGGVCSATASATVIVNPIPTPNVQSATTGYGNPNTRRPGIVCQNSTHTYNVGATPGNVFQWTVTGGTILSGQNTSTVNVQWGTAGVGTIACRESVPGSACVTTDLDSINIRATPLPVVTGTLSPCSNIQHDYTTTLNSGNSYSWSVIGGTFTQIAANTVRVSWAAPVWPNTNSGIVQVTEGVIDVLPATCNSTMGQGVTVRPVPPTPVISGPASVCATDLTDNPPTNNTATYSSSIPAQTAGSGTIAYAWTVTGGTITSSSTAPTITVQWNNSGGSTTVGTITLKHTSSFGCENTGTLNVTINPLPEPKVVGATVACQNTVENYSTNGVPGNSYSWALTGGNFIRAGQGTPNVAVEWTLPGAATLTVSETNAFGCTVQNAMAVTVNALPAATLRVSGPTTFCPTGDITICAPIGFTKYVWNTGETARCIVARTSGQYYCIVTNTNGCSDTSDIVTLNVLAGPQPTIALSGPTTFCQGGSVVLTAPAGFNAYRWSTGETTQSITAAATGNYTVTVADNNGCTGTSAEVDVTVNPAPTPKLTVTGNANFCAGDSVVISAPAGYASYAWVGLLAGGSYGTERTIVVKATDTVFCQVVDIFGCSGVSDTVGVKTPPVVKPVVTAVGSTTFCTGGAVKLVANDGFNAYVWSNGANGQEVTVTEAGDYFVTVIDKATNCPVASTVVKVVVNEAPGKPMISREGDVLTAKTTSTNVEGWSWSRNGAEIVGADQSQYRVGMPGVYTATVKVPGCTSTSDEFEVVFTSVNEDVVAGESVMTVYPNPTNGRATLATTLALTGTVRVDITNALGERVLSMNEVASGAAFGTSIDMTNLSSGVYNVAVTSGNNTWVVSVVRQ
jgi:hypothetical protein